MNKSTPKYTLQPEDARAPHTGHILDDALVSRGLPVAAVARHLGRDRATVADYLRNPTIQTAVLWELCHALERNFFADLAAQLPAHYHSDALAATRAELEKMTAERDLLLRALQGRG